MHRVWVYKPLHFAPDFSTVIMFQLIVFSTLLAVGSNAFPNRIVNGTDAALGEIPYIVSLQQHGVHFCGGSIVDATHVLTAAHCIYGSESADMQIQYGIIDLQSSENIIRVSKKVVHEGYRPGGGYFNDVAVLTLEEPIKFSDNVKAIKLPKQGDSTPGNEPSVLAGWGYEASGGSVQRILQRVDLKIYTDDECEARHSHTTDRTKHVCSGVDEGGKGQCSGDSGGPLYANGVQVGVVSWSVKPCTIKGYPGVFAKVSSYINWLKYQL